MINPTASAGITRNPNGAGSSQALKDLDVSQFLDLMIAELQNQDPLNPMDNAQMLAQIGQIRQIDATTRLSDTLDAVLLGQNLSSASGMIGKEVSGLDTSGKQVAGVVGKVSVREGEPVLHVGDRQVTLKNVAEIVAGSDE